MYRLREVERQDMPIINSWRNNPEIINDRVMVRIRPYYFENKNDRKTKVCEMENFYELYNVLE